jgi:MinD superfamily P-loop ATPase
MILRSWDRPGLRMVAESGYSVEHDASKCVSCGTCVKFCQFEAVESSGGKRTGYVRENCMGCGLCVENCPQGALSLYLDAEKPVPLDLDLVREDFMPHMP